MQRAALLLLTLGCACPDTPKTPPPAVVVSAPTAAPERKLTLVEEVANARTECDGLKAKLAALEGDARKGKMELLDACRRRQADLEAQLPPIDGGLTP